MPSQPSSQALRQSSGRNPESSNSRPTITSLGASRAMKLRALVFNISWLSVRARSMAIAPGPLARPRPGHDAVALLPLEESARRSPRGIGGESGRAHRVEDGPGHPEAGHLAVVGELRPLVGARPLAVDEPEVAQPEKPLDLTLDVDVGQHIAHFLMLDERHAVALRFLAVAEQTLPHAVSPDAPARAVLQLKVRARHLPPVVLAADEGERRDAHVVEEHRVLDSAVGTTLAARSHELHGLDLDARQIRVDHEPGDVLVAAAVWVGARDEPDAIGTVVAAHEDLLAVQDVLVAVAERGHAHAGEIRARAGLGEELPGAHRTRVDRRQEGALLLLRSPDQDRRRTEAA